MSARVKSNADIHTTDESRPMDELMLTNMTALKVVKHFWGFALFILILAVASSFQTSNGWEKIGLMVLLGIASALSLRPWLRDLKRR